MHFSNLTFILLGFSYVLLQSSVLIATSCPNRSDISQAISNKYGTGQLSINVEGREHLRSFNPKDVVIEEVNGSLCIYKMITQGTLIQQSHTPGKTPQACASTTAVKRAFTEKVGNGNAPINIKGITYTRFFEESNVTLEQISDSPCTYRLVVDGLLFK